MIQLAGGQYAMTLDPACGGSVRSLTWRGRHLLREQAQAGVLNSAHFPLVPFCNRITDSCFTFGARRVQLARNHPSAVEEPVLHGFGWNAVWRVEQMSRSYARLEFDYQAADWPWSFKAVQEFELSATGLRMALSLVNQSAEPMPGGLGFHPYFPRDHLTVYLGLHRGERRGDGSIDTRPAATDWWDGKPVGTRNVDATYIGREGPLTIAWPAADLGVTISPNSGLPFTHLYVPADADFFCVEPVSHVPDAFNQGGAEGGVSVIPPGESLSVELSLHAYALSGQ